MKSPRVEFGPKQRSALGPRKSLKPFEYRLSIMENHRGGVQLEGSQRLRPQFRPFVVDIMGGDEFGTEQFAKLNPISCRQRSCQKFDHGSPLANILADTSLADNAQNPKFWPRPNTSSLCMSGFFLCVEQHRLHSGNARDCQGDSGESCSW
jgi:hypothetical protein